MTDLTPLGVLELTDRGTGFLRRREGSYAPDARDLFVPAQVIRQFGLRPGDTITGEAGRPGRGRGPALQRVTAINGRPPAEAAGRPDFTRLTATHPK